MRPTVAPPRFDDEPLFAGNSVFKHQSAALISIPKYKQLASGEHFYLKGQGDYYLIFLLSGSITTYLKGEHLPEHFEAKRMIFVSREQQKQPSCGSSSFFFDVSFLFW